MPLTFGSFPDFLASTLRVEDCIRVYHVSTAPTLVKSIFSPLPAAEDENTTCESHFLAVSRKHVGAYEAVHSDTSDQLGNREVFILGIEILVFDTPSLKTIFVSKADSTGLALRTNSASDTARSSTIKTVISAFIEWLVTQALSKPDENLPHSVTEQPQPQPSTGIETVKTRQNDDVQHTNNQPQPSSRQKVVLSLFARSQNQYLFPGSIENSTKHVLDDRQLIKWWCRLLDKLVQKKWDITLNSGIRSETAETSSTSASIQRDVPPLTADHAHTSTSILPEAYVIVPGCDRADTVRSFFPPSSLSTAGRKWHNTFPVEHLARQDLATTDITSTPARCLIPRLPDDPKARFCDDLDNAGTDDKGQWKSVKTISQFWEMMEYRQECAAGRLVGFIWVVFDLGQSRNAPKKPIDPPLNKQDTQIQQQNGYVEGTDVRLPPTAPASILLSSEQYIELSDLLINDTDFAGLDCATDSTQKWIEKVKTLSGTQLLGVDVTGKHTDESSGYSKTLTSRNGSPEPLNGNKSGDAVLPPSVNTLIGVRKKKRDAETAGVLETALTPSGVDGASDSIAVVRDDAVRDQANMLESGLVRKKPKIRQ